MDELNAFTDGSKTDSGSGSGIFSQELALRASTSLGRYADISQTEIYAIIDICNALTYHDIHDRTVNIYSDSQAAIKKLQSHCFTSKLAIECHSRLTKFQKGMT